MKNIHLIPTDKPSRLKQNKITKKYSLVTKGIDLTSYIPVNIYITNDEEIKIGEYYLCKLSMKPLKCIGDEYFNNIDEKKIILTTDGELIKDGVQAIDDEFLEWFVKNPSCDFVEVIKGIAYRLDEFYDSYEIIIPKEEPKQETLTYSESSKKEERIFNSNIVIKETLEEAAERYAENWNDLENQFARTSCFIAGAKWQQEQIGKSEFLQKLRGTLSNAEARRLILETFKNK